MTDIDSRKSVSGSALPDAGVGMGSNIAPHRSKFWRYALLTCILLACLWAGWRDFDPWLSQGEIRESIRATVRGVIQLLVQLLVPLAILCYFGAEALATLRDKRRRSGGA